MLQLHSTEACFLGAENGVTKRKKIDTARHGPRLSVTCCACFFSAPCLGPSLGPQRHQACLLDVVLECSVDHAHDMTTSWCPSAIGFPSLIHGTSSGIQACRFCRCHERLAAVSVMCTCAPGSGQADGYVACILVVLHEEKEPLGKISPSTMVSLHHPICILFCTYSAGV